MGAVIVTTRTLLLLVPCAAVLAAGAGCGGGSSNGPTGASAPVVQKAATASGDGQSGTAAAALANPLRVLVTLSGAPLAGDTVTWAAVGTGASVSSTRSVTDASGIATTTWTLGQVAGGQSATATLAGATGSPVTFSATAAAGSANQLSLASGDNQSGSPSAALPTQLAAKVADQFGNGVAGSAVTWAVTGGTATVNPSSANSDATGLAKTTVTLGATLGPVTITATSAGLVNSPVTFHATISLAATSAAVSVGDNFFRSGRNSTSNPAVDTIAAGGTLTWTWAGVNSHSVESTGAPSFTTSTVKTSGTYSFTFTSPGTYTYDCGVHGAMMSGRVVVQ